MRILGLDIHRTFAEVVILENGELRRAGQVGLTHDRLTAFAQTLHPDDEVVVEATGNTMAIVRMLGEYVKRVVVANPRQVRVIAHAKVKTDKIDAGVLAQLHASGFLPEVWVPDEATQALRRQVARRNQLVRHRTRLKNEVHSVLHANLIERCPAADLFGRKGRAWLAEQPLPADERLAIQRHVRELEQLGADLNVVEEALAKVAIADARVRRLMTISGVNSIVAISMVAAIGDIERFTSSQKLVSYFGLNPKVRQSGLAPARHGRITKQGRAHVRGMLVEAAWSAAKAPGPLRGFFLRVRARRGHQVAAVATARKLAVLAWHMLSKEEDYLWARPALLAAKLRKLELRAGATPARGQRGGAYSYNLKSVRDQEQAWVERAEHAYERLVANWQPKGQRKRTGAATEARP